MGHQVWVYNWPESQECMECIHSLITVHTNTAICEMNHNKTKEDKCSCFTLMDAVEALRKRGEA